MSGACTCPACGSADLTEIYHLTSTPVQSCILLDTKQDALRFAQGSMRLQFCIGCGFVFNSDFEPSLVDYSAATEESQHFSATFNRFAKDLVAEIASTYPLRGAHVLEIGCGKGDFLREIVSMTGATGLGVDPGFLEGRHADAEDLKLWFHRAYFDPATLDDAPDLILCRHTLEHISEVGQFVSDILAATRGKPDVGVVFETPDVKRVLQDGAFWDIYYEHCSYFSLGSHARLLRRRGLDITRTYLAYGDQYIIQYARPGSGNPLPEEKDLDDLRTLAAQFPSRVAETRAKWRDFVERRHKDGRTIAIWGGGSKCVSFLSTNDLTQEVSEVVDINPYKWGKYLPGTGHRVIAPEDLQTAPPDTVIIMNPAYLSEIGAMLNEMGLSPELVTL